MGCTSSIVLPNTTQTSTPKRETGINDGTHQGDTTHIQPTNQEEEEEEDSESEIDQCEHEEEEDEEEGEDKECTHVTSFADCACIPQVYLNHVICLDEEKKQIKDYLDTFTFNFEDFQEAGMNPTKGILLHGPTGCGKSLLAKAFACKYALNFLAVHAAELTDTVVKELMEELNRNIPCVLLIKHIDFVRKALNKKELKRAMEKLLQQTVDSPARIFVFGTAFKELDVDASFTRTNRLEVMIHIGKPTKEARLIKLRSLLCRHQNASVRYKCLDYSKIADLTHGLTHTDLTKICDIAFTNLGVRIDSLTPEETVSITKEDMLQAITEYCKRIQKDAMIDSPD